MADFEMVVLGLRRTVWAKRVGTVERREKRLGNCKYWTERMTFHVPLVCATRSWKIIQPEPRSGTRTRTPKAKPSGKSKAGPPKQSIVSKGSKFVSDAVCCAVLCCHCAAVCCAVLYPTPSLYCTLNLLRLFKLLPPLSLKALTDLNRFEIN